MPTMIFMAGLQTVPGDLYESAMLDGATTFQRFRYITLPYLMPTFTINMVLTIKAGITSFDYAYALTAGGPSRSTTVIGISIYNDAFNNMKFSLANAEAVILFIIMIFMAGLQTVPGDLYESAMLDGATTFQRFRYITLPYLMPTFTINMVLTIKAGITSFDYAYALTAGGPSRSTTVIGISIYNDAFNNMKFSLANAEAVILFIIIALLSLIQIKISSKGGVN